MTFVDLVTLTVKAGNGGPGASSFRREKFTPKGGPDGGNGGNGGDIIFQANTNLQTLMDLKLKKVFKSKNGQPGLPKKKFGSDADNLLIYVPCGTIIRDENNKVLADLTKDKQSIIIAKGGKGGKGNACFATPKLQAPTYAQPGLPGEELDITLELQLIAELGLIGLPNAGKSTLLHTLTSANPKIGNYPFTTLHPNLGVCKFIDREFVIADIPGLIEGASKGVGLGHEFLRHISRTALLLHLIEIPLENSEKCLENFHTIHNELVQYDNTLAQKKQIVVLSKADLIPEEELQTIKKLFQDIDKPLVVISAHSRYGIEELKAIILQHFTKDLND